MSEYSVQQYTNQEYAQAACFNIFGIYGLTGKSLRELLDDNWLEVHGIHVTLPAGQGTTSGKCKIGDLLVIAEIVNDNPAQVQLNSIQELRAGNNGLLARVVPNSARSFLGTLRPFRKQPGEEGLQEAIAKHLSHRSSGEGHSS